jgi:hypothetical protein
MKRPDPRTAITYVPAALGALCGSIDAGDPNPEGGVGTMPDLEDMRHLQLVLGAMYGPVQFGWRRGISQPLKLGLEN